MFGDLCKVQEPKWMGAGRRAALRAAGAAAGAVAFIQTSLAAQILKGDARGSVRRQPSLFLGHGSPMNALARNGYTEALRGLGESIGRPRAILMVSAHWLTEGYSAISIGDRMQTMHDFEGFPAALYEVSYEPPGVERALIAETRQAIASTKTVMGERALDHGAWSVLKHMYPAADVPVFQLSIDIGLQNANHWRIGRALGKLRDDGVLIVGSGNVVHNLGATVRGAADSQTGLTPWARGFDEAVKSAVDADDDAALVDVWRLSHAAAAHPTPEHYLPLLYARGSASAGERATHVFAGFQSGTISMRCIRWG